MKILAFVIIVGFLHLLLVKDVNSWSWEWLTRWFTSGRRKMEKVSNKTLQIPLSVSKSISEVAATGAVFLRDSAKLNCLGLPTKLFANTIYSSDTEAEDVRFYFFSQKTPGYSGIKIEDDFTLEHVDYSVYRDTIVLVHGFMSSGKEQWLVDMKDAFLKYDDVNVIVVDWQKGSNTWNYIAAAANTQIVGQQIASLFAHIRQFQFDKNVTNVADWGKIHFIGHSLGSHISARAAYGIHESQWNRPDQPSRSAWNVSRITGLDPAQPCFVTADETLKLGKDDAEYVDVIHTNARQLIHLGLGLPEQLGFVDFYPNGGQIQPGCSNGALDGFEYRRGLVVTPNILHTKMPYTNLFLHKN
ncbi:hypothetical protein TSAR_015634 [Trichomalopsis sarcophagae]|uniref:phospholipase A1 n=1 Tax=Trichomalopsis sarcophagae TaxID=543379 RepID=A0A232EG83_9HYME|nr:hypothetical protein TSAR_015634 [Trichomalopsis sarcophagae]